MIFNMKRTSFVIDAFEDIVDIVEHYRHSIKSLFCGRTVQLIVGIEVSTGSIKTIETCL